jgi:transcriptional regulator with XRE-family HTH domain
MRALENERREPEDLGRMVRHAREERRLSQQTFADLAGVGRRSSPIPRRFLRAI